VINLKKIIKHYSNDERETKLKRILLFLFVFTVITAAQKNSYIPLNIKPAYEKGTRSLDGSQDQFIGKTNLSIISK